MGWEFWISTVIVVERSWTNCSKMRQRERRRKRRGRGRGRRGRSPDSPPEPDDKLHGRDQFGNVVALQLQLPRREKVLNRA